MARHSRIFVDIDTQFDFVDPAGALYIPGAELLIPAFERLFASARQSGTRVLASADSHPPNDPEFAVFAPHCIRGTPGQSKIEQTLLPSRIVIEPHHEQADPVRVFEDYQQVVFHKVQLDVFTNPHAHRAVEKLDAGEFVVFGVATEHCVRAAVLGLLQRGKRVLIVRDAVRGIREASTRDACEAMQEAGARWTSVSEVVGSR